MTKLAVLFAGATLMFAAGASKTFTGVVTDTMCGADHAAMGVKPDSKCVRECVKMDPAKWKYALQVGKDTYVLSDQKAGDQYAGAKVKVTGTLDEKSKTIQVQSIAPAK